MKQHSKLIALLALTLAALLMVACSAAEPAAKQEAVVQATAEPAAEAGPVVTAEPSAEPLPAGAVEVSSVDELLAALQEIREDPYLTTMVSAIMNIADDVRNGLVSEQEGVKAAMAICEGAVLDEITDPVERLRLDDSETVIDLLSYVSALKLMEVVRKRRVADEQ